jgi:nitric oxide reductase activation protein
MPALLLPEAAAALGVSVDTIRRRVRKGQLVATHDAEGRLLVEVPTARQPQADAVQDAMQTAAAAWQAPSSPPEPARQVPSTDNADHARALLEEVRRQRDQLEATVGDLRARLDQAETHLTAAEQAQAELRRLLALALQTRALPEPRDEPVPTDGRSSRPWWARWRWWRRR